MPKYKRMSIVCTICKKISCTGIIWFQTIVDAQRKTKTLEVKLHRFLTSEQPVSRSSHFILLGETPSTHWSKCCVGPRALLKVLEQRSIFCPCRVSNRVYSKPQPSRYIGSAKKDIRDRIQKCLFFSVAIACTSYCEFLHIILLSHVLLLQHSL